MAEAARLSSGFLYVVSRSGTTGARQSLPRSLADTVRRARRSAGELPVAIGFGIATPESARRAASLADGVVVGSALVRAAEEAGRAPRRRRGIPGAVARPCLPALCPIENREDAHRGRLPEAAAPPAILPLETLQEILSDRAARKFHAVRRALAAHPRTPRGDALALVATLFWRDLAYLSADAQVHPAIRRAADLDLMRRLPDMALAEKVDLARNVGRGTLQVLRLDPDPRVLASVLENRFASRRTSSRRPSNRGASPESCR